MSWDDPDYNRWHQDRCARIVAEWMREQGAEPGLTAEVERIVLVHEEGGFPEADVVQAADSLSFLETMVHVVAEWVQSGRAPRSAAEGKARHSLERISPELDAARARRPRRCWPRALQRLAAVPAPEEVPGRDAVRPAGPHLLPGPRPLPAHAAVPRPPVLRGARPTARRRASGRRATSRGGRATTPAWAT